MRLFTGLPHPADDLRSRNHNSVHFYEDDSYFLDSLTTLIGTALVEGDSAVVVATRETNPRRTRPRSPPQVRSRASILEEAAVKTGRYCALDAAETLSKFMVQGVPDAARFSAYMGYFLSSPQPARTESSPHLFLFGEMVALLSSEGNIEAAIKLRTALLERSREYVHLRPPLRLLDEEL